LVVPLCHLTRLEVRNVIVFFLTAFLISELLLDINKATQSIHLFQGYLAAALLDSKQWFKNPWSYTSPLTHISLLGTAYLSIEINLPLHKISLLKQQFVATHELRQTEIPALFDSWVTNTYYQNDVSTKYLLSSYFLKKT